MSTISRRKFIEQSALASSAALMPSFVSAMASAVKKQATEKKLVIIHLFGGNDGLNTLVPFENDLYYNARKNIAIKPANVLRVNNGLGFNPSLKSLYKLFRDGKMCIINGVGYPNPEFSHFKSSLVWHRGTEEKFVKTGWLGRYLDNSDPEGMSPHKVVLFNDYLNLAVRGNKSNGIALSNFILNDGAFYKGFSRKLIEESLVPAGSDDYNDFIYQTARKAYQSFDYLVEHNLEKQTLISYPDYFFGSNLKTIAGLIRGNAETKVYYTILSGFDTHADQKAHHNNLLEQFSNSLEAFVNDLTESNLFDDTCIMVFSEFGRSLFENASGGTDHGTTNSVYMLSGKLRKKGFYNAYPDLTTKMHYIPHYVDFRSVYATLLKRWLGTDDKLVLNKDYPLLDFI